MEKLQAIWQLMRMDRPIGIYLLLWPTGWALWLAADGVPNLWVLAIFVIGVVVMRSAGCVINDFADRRVDGEVKRTSQRPIVSGRVTAKESLVVFFSLLLVALFLAFQLNRDTLIFAFGGALLASIYPFMKRYTHLPQVVLGAAFSWGIPMAFMAIQLQVPALAWWLFSANLLWTVAYDSQYAMVDRDDDILIGVKSTAILFGKFDLLIISLLQFATVISLCVVGNMAALSWPYYLGLTVMVALFVWQFRLTRHREREGCFAAFLNNHYAGLAVLIGLITHYAIA